MAGFDRTIRKQNPLFVTELFQLSNDIYMQTEQRWSYKKHTYATENVIKTDAQVMLLRLDIILVCNLQGHLDQSWVSLK